MMRLLFLLMITLHFLVACAPSAEAPITTLPTQLPTSAPTETPVVCEPSDVHESQIGFGEIQGDMDSAGELWALLFFNNASAKADLKIVWRITGEGDTFEAQARSESGTIIQPIWQEYHEGSNWERPGEEWGTGFNFPEPGCWTIAVRNGETTGTIALKVSR